jgi:hypothetical protein
MFDRLGGPARFELQLVVISVQVVSVFRSALAAGRGSTPPALPRTAPPGHTPT